MRSTYPFTKRFFALPQAYLGIAFGFGIPMAFAAQPGRCPRSHGVLLLANMFWAIAYDTEYAMVDRDDDRRIGIKTSAILFGRYDVAAVMICHAMFLSILAWIGWRYSLGGYYLRRTADGGLAGGDAVPDDPGSRSASVFPRVPGQQLGRRRDLCRNSPWCSSAAACSRRLPMSRS